MRGGERGDRARVRAWRTRGKGISRRSSRSAPWREARRAIERGAACSWTKRSAKPLRGGNRVGAPSRHVGARGGARRVRRAETSARRGARGARFGENVVLAPRVRHRRARAHRRERGHRAARLRLGDEDGADVRAMPQLGGVVIEDDVCIGPLCTIDAGTLAPTRIRRGAKLDAQVHVGHNVDVGEGCMRRGAGRARRVGGARARRPRRWTSRNRRSRARRRRRAHRREERRHRRCTRGRGRGRIPRRPRPRMRWLARALPRSPIAE